MYGPKEEVPFIEFVDADDIWVRFYTIPKAGYAVPQHAHEHDHISLLCAGSVDAYQDGRFIGRFDAPKSILIQANTKHRFETLTDNVVLACVHNMRGREGQPVIVEHHEL